jgi:drug/metabolite transporter (DMT)-like permease|tara:strand:- start:2339 stop:3157 length:819 start_codon:yes stop_codon:yes gene_type:complete
MLLFVTMDSLAKYLTQSYPVAQVVWARYFFHMSFLVLLFNRRIPTLLRSRRLPLQLGRSTLLVATTVLFFFAVSEMALVNASAIMLTAPMLVTILSVFLLDEQVGVRRSLAIVIGFGGALVILRPGSELFQLWALFPLGAAVLYAFYQVTTRMLSKSDGPLTTLLYTALVGTLLSSLIVPVYWLTPDLKGWTIMVSLGFFGGVSQFCLIKAFQAAPASSVAPFSYSNMIWATLFGYIIFDDLPDFWTVIGAVILISSGLYIFHREHLRKAAN